MWQIARSFWLATTPNGITDGEWLCTTAFTSGRAL